ncbi:hypothetical protein IFM89_039727 [Coptis chinensis]|uniref:non-specific serine/threonine protein kinase n=1 Tax=Coptis chinensis TaxID=261450 RepID=A0A835GSX5_9MAGN|nr:hypothetical protein IFM89_039727 [Coptis chinensis]
MTKPKTYLSNFFLKLFSDKGDQKEEDLEKIAASEQKFFSYDALVSATKDFHRDHKLGEGGFGPVYKVGISCVCDLLYDKDAKFIAVLFNVYALKGKLEDGREVAVKKLSHNSRQGKKEFLNEAKLLARVQHRNVVNLLGFCTHGTEKLLVYEYLPHQSLDRYLFHGHRLELNWKKRYDVITGVARGLLYLHEDSHISIIHRDIKASNILLDEKWGPKIADFGMARLFPEDQTHVNTRVAGTRERSTCAIRVFKPIMMLAWKLYKKGKNSEIMDAMIASEADIEQVDMCTKIGLLCVQADPKLRPNMRRVVVMLSKKSNTLEEPERPGYPGCRYKRANKVAGSSTAESGKSYQRPAISSSMTGSSGESSSQAFSATSSTVTKPIPLSHGTTGSSGESSSQAFSATSSTVTKPIPLSHGTTTDTTTRSSSPQFPEKHSTSRSTITYHSSGKRPMVG